MKRGRPHKNVWPVWAIKAIRSMGFSEDMLETAMKVGLKTIEIDAAQLIERKRSINEAWNDSPPKIGGGEEHLDLRTSESGTNGSYLAEEQPGVDQTEPDRSCYAGERSGHSPEDLPPADVSEENI